MDCGVATRPIADFDAYRAQLNQFVYHSGSVMQPVFSAAQRAPKRVIYAEGEDERVLRAVQVVVDEGLARPLLIGRTPRPSNSACASSGCASSRGATSTVVDVETDARLPECGRRLPRAPASQGRHAARPPSKRCGRIPPRWPRC